MPSVAIITTEFVRETELTRRAIGMQALHPVVIDHAVNSITTRRSGSKIRQIFSSCDRTRPDQPLNQRCGQAGA
jgi:hypothetical protein